MDLRPHRSPLLKRLIVGTALVASAIIALHIGYWRIPQLMNARGQAPPAAGASTAASPVLAGPLELSVFDQPRALPEIHFADDQDHKLTLTDFRGTVVLLNIWATWCVPCRKEMPALDRLQAQLGGDDFVVLPLSIDRAGLPAVKRFYEELGLQKLGIYIDASGAASRALGA